MLPASTRPRVTNAFLPTTYTTVLASSVILRYLAVCAAPTLRCASNVPVIVITSMQLAAASNAQGLRTARSATRLLASLATKATILALEVVPHAPLIAPPVLFLVPTVLHVP